jgi:hypothetical protein
MGETLRIQRSRRMHVAVGNDGDGNVLGPRGVVFLLFNPSPYTMGQYRGTC